MADDGENGPVVKDPIPEPPPCPECGKRHTGLCKSGSETGQ